MARGVGLTLHRVVVDRSLAAVATVNETLAKAVDNGGLREFNAAFKAARAADPSLRYADYIEARKVGMLEALVRG